MMGMMQKDNDEDIVHQGNKSQGICLLGKHFLPHFSCRCFAVYANDAPPRSVLGRLKVKARATIADKTIRCVGLIDEWYKRSVALQLSEIPTMIRRRSAA